MISEFLAVLNMFVIALLSIYGALGLFTLWLYWKHRNREYSLPNQSEADLPFVTVQLPVFNERFVIKRLIDSAVQLEYPRDRLQIQVIDDSTDQTTDIAAARVSHYKELNIAIEHIFIVG